MSDYTPTPAPQFLTDAYWLAHNRVEVEHAAQGIDQLDREAEAFFAGLRAVEAAVRADAKAEALEEAAKAGAGYVVNPNTSRDYQDGARTADTYWQIALERAAAAIRAQLTETGKTDE